jgi:P-type Cu2+ transporter
VSAVSSNRLSPVCLHCGAAIAGDARFCCPGCAAVHAFLGQAGLDRYYDLRGPEGVPAIAAGEVADARADRKWLEPIAETLAAGAGDEAPLTRVELDVQGVHCSACVWLFEAIFRRYPGGAGIVVNPAAGRVDLTVAPGFDLTEFVGTIERLGYRFGPATGRSARAPRSDLVWRMGVCIALAMNAMIFAVAIYCGLGPGPDDGPVYRLFQALELGLSTLSVVVGGTVFFRSAWRALRSRALHLDLPIALGIALAWASSTYAYVARGGATSFFDTITVFVALMLVGRFLQERVVARNRAQILASSGAEHLFTRRIDPLTGRVALARCVDIVAGDVLLVARGDLVPVDAKLRDDAPFSLDWINGESRPRTYRAGQTVPAGAFSCGEAPRIVDATSSFESGALASLLRASRTRERDVARATPFWSRLARVYVGGVLVLAFAAFGGWLLATGDALRALDVVTAILIVTCPCAFGIATPLAYELAQAGLRRNGLFVRSPAFLDRAQHVRRVVFDKTGTLTTGSLRLANPKALAALSEEERAALYAMTAASGHPKSQAIAGALPEGRLTSGAAADRLVERDGKGVELTRNGHVYRLGSAAFTRAIGPGDVLFTVDGVLRASLATTEDLRPDAVAEIRALEEAGYAAAILSGDAPLRVRELAAMCGIPESRAIGGASPSDKAEWVRARDCGDMLFLGDGINDALVADVATCSGTPAIDRPFMAARSDFYVVAAGLRPIRLALVVARRLARVVRRNLAIAIVYNVVTIGLALAGRMSPLLCAVLMPLASLSTVAATTVALSRRNALWRS